MPYRRIFFEKNRPFHIISRAVDEKKIFKEKKDRCRFLFQIFAANIGKPAFNLQQKDVTKAVRSLLQGEEVSSKFIIKEHPPLVDILDFSLVVHHSHFYLIANFENSPPIFMQRLNMGFAKFFNAKYGRKGALFGSRYHAVAIETDFQSQAVSRYVSVINPLDVYQPNWREAGLRDWKRAFEFLENYPCSSFPERIGKRKSKIVAREEILERYNLKDKKDEHIQFVKDFLKKQLPTFQDFFIE